MLFLQRIDLHMLMFQNILCSVFAIARDKIRLLIYIQFVLIFIKTIFQKNRPQLQGKIIF